LSLAKKWVKICKISKNPKNVWQKKNIFLSNPVDKMEQIRKFMGHILVVKMPPEFWEVSDAIWNDKIPKMSGKKKICFRRTRAARYIIGA
jgi:hypothetical protein